MCARGMGEDASQNPGPGLHFESVLNRKMKAEVRALVEALERCLKTQSDFDAVSKLNDKLKKQISDLKTSDEQREKILRLTDEIKERGREASELRVEQEALKKINRDQKKWKQWEQNVNVEDTKRIAELQATSNELKTTINELKEKKHRVEVKLKEKESVAEVAEQKYKALMALVTKAELSGVSKIESNGPLPRGCEVEYLNKHLATLQHCKEVDEKNHAALLQHGLKQLRDNRNRVAQQQNLLLSKEEEIRQNNELLKNLKAHNRLFPNTLPPIQHEEKPKKERKKASSSLERKKPQKPAAAASMTQGAATSSSSSAPKRGVTTQDGSPDNADQTTSRNEDSVEKNRETKSRPGGPGEGTTQIASKSASQPNLHHDSRGKGKGAGARGGKNRKGGLLQRGESDGVPTRKGQSPKSQTARQVPRPPETPHGGSVRGHARRPKPMGVPHVLTGKSSTDNRARQQAQNYVNELIQQAAETISDEDPS